jgi:hypothetical protein
MYLRRTVPILILAAVLLLSSCSRPYYRRAKRKRGGCGCPGGFGRIECVDTVRTTV